MAFVHYVVAVRTPASARYHGPGPLELTSDIGQRACCSRYPYGVSIFYSWAAMPGWIPSMARGLLVRPALTVADF